MNFENITNFIWENSKQLNFGKNKSWDDKTFLKEWIDNIDTSIWHNEEGLYWFQVNKSVEQIKSIVTPQSFPEKGVRFADIASTNEELLESYLCHNKSKIPVIYNGEAKSVFSRIRDHFSLNNNTTSALAISQYSLSNDSWKVSVYHIGMLRENQYLSDTDKIRIEKLLKSKTGRLALENSWRTIFGWPILCEK